MVTTEVRVTAEASTSEYHVTPPPTPTPSIAPVLPCKPATHHGHHPWASPSVDGHDFNDDFDLEHEATMSSSRSHSQRTRKKTAANTTSGPAVAPYTTISSISTNYISPTSTRRRGGAASSGPSRPNRNNRKHWPSRLASGTRHFLAKLGNLDPVKLAYLRTSFVFAISILITWAPSSINRVYTLAYPTRFNFGLNMASAVVLPLQGVWNAVIYCATSWHVLAGEVADLAHRWFGPRAGAGRRRRRSDFFVGASVGFGDGFDGGGRRRTRERGFELSPTPKVSTMRVVRGSF